MTMQPEHEEFLKDHVKRMGFFFIVDCLKRQFPSLSHRDACTIYEEFRSLHDDDPDMKSADEQIKAVGKKVADDVSRLLRREGGE